MSRERQSLSTQPDDDAFVLVLFGLLIFGFAMFVGLAFHIHF
jgi:hypothetical protein